MIPLTTEVFAELDVGCGDRTDLPVRLDIKRSGGANVLADAHHLPFRSEVFRHVRVLEVLEHLASPYMTLLECQRVLEPEGVLILQVPNPYYVGKLGRLLINRGEKLRQREKDHKQAWDQVTLSSLLHQAGFSQTSFYYPNYYGVRRKVLHLLPKILGRTHLQALAVKKLQS